MLTNSRIQNGKNVDLKFLTVIIGLVGCVRSQANQRMLENILEDNYDPELSRHLDLVLCLLGV